MELTQARCRRLCRPSLSVTSAAFMAFCENVGKLLFSYCASKRTYRKILFVGENQEQSIPQFIFIQHTLQFLTSLDDTVTIIAVNDEDDTLSVLEVMPPQRSDLILSTDIPDSKLNVLVLDRFNVEACANLHVSTNKILIAKLKGV